MMINVGSYYQSIPIIDGDVIYIMLRSEYSSIDVG